MSIETIIAEARARIIWGEPPLEVRDFLISNGVSDLVADAKLKEFLIERNQELRRIGLRNVLIGAVLTIAASITIYLWLPFLGNANYGVGLVGIAGIYGFWKLVRGIVYLVRPQSEPKSMADIEQSDLIE
ncbi:MAG TPA: hypothetical protein VFE51_03570 [Verrucomicrobiae bacterium]|nr:hypothetical protein [Verrucomicrobiae bacterium]